MLKRILTLFVLFALLVSTGVAGQVPTASPQVETLLYEAGADKTPLRGVIGIPQGSNSPLVVLLLPPPPPSIPPPCDNTQ